ASSSTGDRSVIVWTSSASSTNRDIYAQRYDGLGNPVGAEIAVDTSTADDSDPAVSMDRNCEFVVVWTRALPNGDRNIVAKVYDGYTGSSIAAFDVETSPLPEYEPDVAWTKQDAHAPNEITVSYTLGNPGNQDPEGALGKQEAYFQRFTYTGTPIDAAPRILV